MGATKGGRRFGQQGLLSSDERPCGLLLPAAREAARTGLSSAPHARQQQPHLRTSRPHPQKQARRKAETDLIAVALYDVDLWRDRLEVLVRLGVADVARAQYRLDLAWFGRPAAVGGRRGDGGGKGMGGGRAKAGERATRGRAFGRDAQPAAKRAMVRVGRQANAVASARATVRSGRK